MGNSSDPFAKEKMHSFPYSNSPATQRQDWWYSYSTHSPLLPFSNKPLLPSCVSARHKAVQLDATHPSLPCYSLLYASPHQCHNVCNFHILSLSKVFLPSVWALSLFPYAGKCTCWCTSSTSILRNGRTIRKKELGLLMEQNCPSVPHLTTHILLHCWERETDRKRRKGEGKRETIILE